MNNRKALKSGVWYVISSFLVRGIGFLTTPIFSRLLSTAEFGLYNNYSSWMAIISVFVTLNLESTLIRAKYDYEESFDEYILSMLGLSSLSALIWLLVFNSFWFFFENVFGIEKFYINIMCCYLLLNPFISMYLGRARYYFEYKKSAILSTGVSICTAIISVLLVVYLPNKLTGRIIGSACPTILVGLVLAAYFFRIGKRINIHYWRYALPICMPYIPHVFSLIILNAVDRIMITKICGATENAIYSLAYSCASIITMLVGAMNSAFAPWIGEKLHENDYTIIKKVSRIYTIAFISGAIYIILITPEIVSILGGYRYKAGIWVLPPIAGGAIMQFMYCIFVNVEQFEKKTTWMAVASVSAAILNYVLNVIFIPRYGYLAAAYTTLIGYTWLLISHMLIVYHYGFHTTFDYHFFISMIIICFVTVFISTVLFHHPILRLSVAFIYCILLIYGWLRYRKSIIKLLRRENKT